MSLTGRDVEDMLIRAIEINSHIEADDDDEVIFPDVDWIQRFSEGGACTLDNGLRVLLNDGTEIYLTIQVYPPYKQEEVI